MNSASPYLTVTCRTLSFMESFLFRYFTGYRFFNGSFKGRTWAPVEGKNSLERALAILHPIYLEKVSSPTFDETFELCLVKGSVGSFNSAC